MLKDNSPEALRVAEALGLTEEGQKNLLEARKIRLEKAAQLKTNANEIMHTTNTGYGKETVPVDVLQAELFDAIPSYATFLNRLPGFHGYDMGSSDKVGVIGDVGFFRGNSEQTTGAFARAQGTNRLATGEVVIEQKSMILTVDVSKRLMNYSIADLQRILIAKIAASWARTAEAAILNSDAETGGTGNVNSDDQAPATTFATEGGADYYALLSDHGLRELAVNGGYTVAVGTLEIADLLSMLNMLGDFAADPSELLWLFNRATYNKALGLQAFYDASQRGEKSTLSGQAITNIFGADLFTPRDLKLTEADGKISATPGNNTKGQIGLLWTPAVQYGYGQSFEIDIDKVPGKGLQIVATVDFGFTIVQQKAGVTDSVLAVGRDVTV